jgi:hypothetical protein
VDGPTITGWCLVGTGLLDLLLAFFFVFVKPLPDERQRRIFPAALGLGAVLMLGLGGALLAGWVRF